MGEKIGTYLAVQECKDKTYKKDILLLNTEVVFKNNVNITTKRSIKINKKPNDSLPNVSQERVYLNGNRHVMDISPSLSSGQRCTSLNTQR